MRSEGGRGACGRRLVRAVMPARICLGVTPEEAACDKGRRRLMLEPSDESSQEPDVKSWHANGIQEQVSS